jgi:hypothetical protein
VRFQYRELRIGDVAAAPQLARVSHAVMRSFLAV